MVKLSAHFNSFERAYLKLRQEEGWIMSDKQLKSLPFTKKGDPNHDQWRLRAYSLKKLLAFLQKEERGTLLDLGCGNGWMTAKIAELGYEVTGMDVNGTELKQAQRVFGKNIHWALEDVFLHQADPGFKFIILSASFQYFEDADKLLIKLISLLAKNGSLVIMDTYIYDEDEIESATKRSAAYYKSKGADTMLKHYFHRSEKNFSLYQWEYIFKAKGKWHRKLLRSTPFPIIRIIKQ
jgi:ubiquinone/menaquinone biosynthesis C-methylase UbiE